MLIYLAIAANLVGCVNIALSVIAADRGMRATPYYGIAALSTAAASVFMALADMRLWSYVAAATAAVNAYQWWRSGGGDGTRRRLKQWAGRFHGVRRTAPNPT